MDKVKDLNPIEAYVVIHWSRTLRSVPYRERDIGKVVKEIFRCKG